MSKQHHEPTAFTNHFTGNTGDYTGTYSVASETGDILYSFELAIENGEWVATLSERYTESNKITKTKYRKVDVMHSEIRTEQFKARFQELKTLVNNRRKKLHGFVMNGMFFCRAERR